MDVKRVKTLIYELERLIDIKKGLMGTRYNIVIQDGNGEKIDEPFNLNEYFLKSVNSEIAKVEYQICIARINTESLHEGDSA